MKKGLMTMMALMLGMSGMMAQSTVVVAGAGDATIEQGETLEIRCDGSPITFTNDGKIVLTSFKDYDITIPDLTNLKITGAGDVKSRGKLTFPVLDILISGTGDADLNVECDTIKAKLTGIGDLKLNGHCHYLEATITGLGDLDFNNFKADSLFIEKTSKSKSEWKWEYGTSDGNNGESKQHKSLLFHPNWDGFEAGLNMLLSDLPNGDFKGSYALLEQRPLKSWNFNFNIAAAGIAFSRTHRAGLYTGIGLGWNNYSFNNPVRLYTDDFGLVCDPIDEEVEGRVKKSKLGVLYVQSPLMLEVRPTRKTYIAFGVTGGFRINAWTKIKFQDGYVEKSHNDYYINRFKLDASVRGGGSHMGFYANYNLLPVFDESKAPTAHSLSFGLSWNF